MTEWVTRDAALAALGIRPQTLYAYVSRGRIGVRPDPADPRRSLYRAEDVAALGARAARGRKTADIAASAFSWGEPAITTGVSTVRHGVLVYRGLDAVEWAETATLETTAALLWRAGAEAQLSGAGGAFCGSVRGPGGAGRGRARRPWGGAPTGCTGTPRRRSATSRRALASRAATSRSIRRLGRAWSLGPADVDRARRTLVLIADHELNASAFAARVAASTGASVAAALLAGLCALSGPRHGGAGRALNALMDEAAKSGAGAAVGGWLARGHGLPGFGHPLYPGGDPRAIAILDGLAIDGVSRAVRDAAYDATGARPNVDFALAAFGRASGLPVDAPFCLFLIGRSVGWAAHIVEQAATGTLIRPRARYEGPAPRAR